jgi:hypothetical protein
MDKAGREVHPAALATLELRIDEIVRTKQWVETQGTAGDPPP